MRNLAIEVYTCRFGTDYRNWDNELVERFTHRNEMGKQFSDITTAIFIDLTQADRIVIKPVSEMNDIEQWVIYFAKAGNSKYKDVINEILKRKEGISVAYEMLNTISMDENERADFRSRRMWQMDRDHEIAQAIYEGREQARLEFEQIKAEFEQARAEAEQARAEREKELADQNAIIAELRAKLEGRIS